MGLEAKVAKQSKHAPARYKEHYPCTYNDKRPVSGIGQEEKKRREKSEGVGDKGSLATKTTEVRRLLACW